MGQRGAIAAVALLGVLLLAGLAPLSAHAEVAMSGGIPIAFPSGGSYFSTHTSTVPTASVVDTAVVSASQVTTLSFDAQQAGSSAVRSTLSFSSSWTPRQNGDFAYYAEGEITDTLWVRQFSGNPWALEYQGWIYSSPNLGQISMVGVTSPNLSNWSGKAGAFTGQTQSGFTADPSTTVRWFLKVTGHYDPGSGMRTWSIRRGIQVVGYQVTTWESATDQGATASSYPAITMSTSADWYMDSQGYNGSGTLIDRTGWTYKKRAEGRVFASYSYDPDVIEVMDGRLWDAGQAFQESPPADTSSLFDGVAGWLQGNFAAVVDTIEKASLSLRNFFWPFTQGIRILTGGS